eukprot:Pgem_evm2s2523
MCYYSFYESCESNAVGNVVTSESNVVASESEIVDNVVVGENNLVNGVVASESNAFTSNTYTSFNLTLYARLT